MEKGKIYIATMNYRGKHAERIDPNSIKINVTSCQAKNNKNRRDFSPMTTVEGGYKGYLNFEAYWQAGKVYEGIPEEESKLWWKSITKARKQYPQSKNKRVLYGSFEGYSENLDCIESRKYVYIPEYYNLIKDREMTIYWREKLNQGVSLAFYDLHGPRKENGDPDCIEVTEEDLKDKLENPEYPFGHSYIVAAAVSYLY